jgi:exopolysaccharide biosynthesis protein
VKKKRVFRRAVCCAAPVFLLVFLFYGPFEGFRLLWINTAMYSRSCKFLAQALYSGDYIRQVLNRNKPQVERATNRETPEYTASPNIAFAPIKGNYFKGFLLRIDDPSRVFLTLAGNEKGKLLEDLVAEYRGLGGVNASAYSDHTKKGRLWGTTIVNGEVVSRCSIGNRHVMGGFTEDYQLVVGNFTNEEIAARGYVWAFEFGPLLVVNGEKAELTAYSGGISPRTAIGQTREGHILLVVVDGRQPASIGATYRHIQTILYANGAVNAIGLDGGSSSAMVYGGKLVNSPFCEDDDRLLPNAIIFR